MKVKPILKQIVFFGLIISSAYIHEGTVWNYIGVVVPIVAASLLNDYSE